MGQQTAAIDTIHHATTHCLIMRQSPGEKLLYDRPARQELLLLTRLVGAAEAGVEEELRRRKELGGKFLAELVEYAREAQSYCSDISVLHALFRQPFKSLAQEMANRGEVGECFEEGEIMMVGYCVLTALQTYRGFDPHYDLEVSLQTLFIDVQGSIVLSDVDRYREKCSRRSSIRRIQGESGRNQRNALKQLGAVMQQLLATSQANCDNFLIFVDGLATGCFQHYEEALQQLSHIKKLERTHSARHLAHQPPPRPHSHSQHTPDHESQHHSGRTPINELTQLLDRQPLGCLENKPQQLHIRSLNFMSKRKENKCHAYKSQFQARKAEAFAEDSKENRQAEWLEDNYTLRLDEMSSIHERNTNKATEEDEEDNNNNNPILAYPSLTLNDEPDQMKIELFSQSRPERLKQLILNQKGIIYEESADELESLASQRTHRFRQPSLD